MSGALAFVAMQHVDGIDADFVDHVAAFHDEQRGATDARDQLADADEIVTFEQEVADRVVLERIDPEEITST